MDKPTIRIFIIEYSVPMQRALSRVIRQGQHFEVVGIAIDGGTAMAMIDDLSPDVILMNVDIPIYEGRGIIESILAHHSIPIVMMSGRNADSANMTLLCLHDGAVDVIVKPSGELPDDIPSIRHAIWQSLSHATHTQLKPSTAPSIYYEPIKTPSHSPELASSLIAIGASTGGPRVLLNTLRALPRTLSAAIVVVQHFPPAFTAALATLCDAQCRFTVREARQGDALEEGVVLIAPGGHHLRIDANRRVALSMEPRICGVRPAIDPMMQTAADVFGARCMGVLLSGFGHDGVEGLTAIRDAGGATAAQSPLSCLAPAMPRAAVRAHAADQLIHELDLPTALTTWCDMQDALKMDLSLSANKGIIRQKRSINIAS